MKRTFDDLKDDFMCAICNDLIVVPVSLSCGHNFCQSCISKWLDTNPKCPMCRTVMTEEAVMSLAVNIPMQKIISQIMRHSKSYKKRKKKMEKDVQHKTYAKNFLSSPRFIKLCFEMSELFENKEGVLEYNKITSALPSTENFSQPEVDLYIYQRGIIEQEILMIKDYLIDTSWIIDSLSLINELNVLDPKVLLYMLTVCSDIRDSMMYDILEEQLLPYSKPPVMSFDHVTSGSKVFRALHKQQKKK